MPSYGVVDTGANFVINEHFEVGVHVNNLLDDEHWEAFGGDLLGRRALGQRHLPLVERAGSAAGARLRVDTPGKRAVDSPRRSGRSAAW